MVNIFKLFPKFISARWIFQKPKQKKFVIYDFGNSHILFNYINEYVRRTENGTGDHFHITYGLKARAGTFAGLERDEAIKGGKILEAAIGTDALKPTPVIIPFKDIQKEYNAFIKKREQDFQSKKATEQATSFIPKSKRGRI